MLAVYAARASGKRVATLLSSIAGIGGGAAIAIKPYFALALLFPLLYVGSNWKQKRSGLGALFLTPEHVCATLVVLSYVALVFFAFPSYIERMLPLVLTLYTALKYSPLVLLGNPTVVLVGMSMFVAFGLGMNTSPSPVDRIASLAVVGFLGAMFLQGKGWPYHGYPALALTMFVCWRLLIAHAPQSKRELRTGSKIKDFAFGGTLLVATYALASYWLLIEPNPAELVSEVARLGPPHPRVISISGGPGLAFPLIRKLSGTPVGRAPFQWVSEYAELLLQSDRLSASSRKRIEELARLDRLELCGDIRFGKPDVILFGSQAERQFAFSHSDIAATLRPYYRVEAVNNVEIWLRIPPVGGHS